MTLTASRDEFGAAVRRELQQRAGSHCSICRCLTDGPTSESNGVLSVGVAAHITAAAEGGPRFDPALSPEDRASAVNGIWLCQTCAREIDRDLGRYTRERLVEIKLGHEARARSRIGREPTDASTARTATLEALALHEIRRTNFELLGAPPERYEVILQRIIPFVDPIQYGPAVGMEFMDVLNGAAYRIRGTPLERNPSKREALADAAWALRGAVTHGLPIGGEMSGDEESGDEERVLCVAADVGGQLAYDGSLYTEDLRVGSWRGDPLVSATSSRSREERGGSANR